MSSNEPLPYFVHPTAVVDEPCDIGPGARIWHFCHLMAGARVGADSSLGQNVFVAAGAVVGARVKVQNNVSLYDGVVIEDDAFLGPSCVLTNVKNPRSEVSRRDAFARTLIRRGATLGANATVVCGVTVGRYALVAAGAVVTHDVADHALVVGVPARRVGWVGRRGVRLAGPGPDGVLSCPESGERYREEGGTLVALERGATGTR
ncbi:MAG: N-acetyltransferase [Polyangiaceae bacterium]|nr:N-acetyltransferase [Polyangiaceae bacterium]